MALGSKKTNIVIMPPVDGWKPVDALPVKVCPGVCIVAMDPRPEKRGLIELPGEVVGHLLPNAGTVVGVGADVPYRRNSCPPVEMEVGEGDHVLVLPYAGVRYRRLMEGDWKHKDVRLFGNVSEDAFTPEAEPYWYGVIGKLTGTRIEPIGDWIFLKLDPVKQNGVLIPDDVKRGNWKGTIVEPSRRAKEHGFDAGMRVMYHAPSCIVGFDFLNEDYGLVMEENGEPVSYAMVRYTECYACWEDAA